jgi:hypothetical protein
MPFARVSDRLDAQNAQIVSDRVLSRPGWSDVVFAFHDAEDIGPRIHVFSIRCSMLDVLCTKNETAQPDACGLGALS